MDALAIYAIATGGIFAGLILTQILSIFINWTNLLSVLVSRYLALPFVVHRHRLWGPWSRASVLLHVSYAVINIFLIFFRIESLTGAGHRAGELALVNLIFPLSATHLSYLADLLGITWRTCCRIHRATGWMAVALLSFHIIAEVQAQQFSFPLSQSQNLFTMIVCFPLLSFAPANIDKGAISLGVLALFSIPWFRRWSYEIFLRGHQVLAGLFVYGTWRHLPTKSSPPKLYLWVALGILGLTSCLQLVTLLCRNGLFAGCGAPRALVSFISRELKENRITVTAAQIRVLLPRPVQVEPGQYINLWMPSVGLWSWAQTHPFSHIMVSG